MSVLIKGMKMPKCCADCMKSDLRTTIKCTEWTEIDAGLRETRRSLLCPLVEIPEKHGRLIDADEMNLLWSGCYFDGSIKPLLDARPTVIEAEGADE